MSNFWTDETKAEKKRRALSAKDCKHDMVQYTGTKRRGWKYLWTKPDLICLKCGLVNDDI